MTDCYTFSNQDSIYYHQENDNQSRYQFPEPSQRSSWEMTTPNLSDSIHDVSDVMEYDDDNLSFTSEVFGNSERCPLEYADHSSPALCSPESQPKATLSVDSFATNTTCNSSTTVIDPVELQLEFLRTLKKLDRSIQRTDQSRSVIKRLHAASFMDRSEWHQIEEHRQQFAEMIHRDSLTRTVF
jgi:hypothetical protein